MKADLVTLEDYESRTSNPRRFELLSYPEMLTLSETSWLIDDIIQRGSTALMFGRSNTFKSFLAIDLGLSVATGRPWHGKMVGCGDVLFVATEGASAVGRLRIPAWFEAKSIPLGARRAFLFPHEIRLDVYDEVLSLIEAMKRQGPFALLVLDIFGGTMAGSEIEDRTARLWVHGIQRIVRETGASVLTVAHTGWQDDSRARMHTHFWGSFDTRIKVEGNKTALTASISIDRHKDADSSGAWGFTFEKVAGSLVPVFDPTVEVRSETIPKSHRIALQALDEALISHGLQQTGEHWPTNTKTVSIEQWRVQFYERHGAGTSQAKRQAFHRAREALLGKTLIHIYGDRVWRRFDG